MKEIKTINTNNIQNLESIRNGEKIILSNSMISEFKTCERKFVFSYVLNKDIDEDYIQPKYFAFGNAFHEIMEEINHDPMKFTVEILNRVSDKHGLDPVYEKSKLVQCVNLYLKEAPKSGLKVIATEVYFKNKNAGTVDAIGVDKDNNWWIIDLKTAASLSSLRVEMLSVDSQMALYAYHADDIKKSVEDLLNVKLGDFLGIRLREVTKAKERKKKVEETFDQFYDRLSPIEYRELILKKEYIECEEVQFYMEVESERANDTIKRYVESGENIKCVPRNVRKCTDPITKEICPYFKTCHGKSAREILKQEVELKSLSELLDF